MVYRWPENPITDIADCRGECGPPPLRVCEQAPPVALGTSEISKKEGTATEHQLLLLSHPWECNSTQKPLQLINAFRKVAGYNMNTQKWVALLHTNKKKFGKGGVPIGLSGMNLTSIHEDIGSIPGLTQ